jgi:hypothetical protein
MLRTTAAVLTGLAVGTVAFGLSAPAHADEDSYVSYLDGKGVYYESILDVIDLGKLSCHRMRKGQSARSTLDNVVATGYSDREANLIVSAAMGEMCNDQLYRARKFKDDNIG